MLCKKPYMFKNMPCPCGRCMPCRINHKRLWTHRLMLENMCHASTTFATLTYDSDHVPTNGSVSPEDVRLWLMRLRTALIDYSTKQGIPPIRFRYFLVGEYGDQTQRPHYHAALFGIGPEFEEMVNLTWGKGHVMLAEFNLHTAQYICGYVTKKMTSKEDVRLNGRHPEFTRMSRRPGLGALTIDDLGETLSSVHGQSEIKKAGDVPSALRHGGRLLPLGRYLRKKLRRKLEVCSIDPETGEIKYDTPEENLSIYRQELLDVWKAERNDPRYSKDAQVSLKRFLVEKFAGNVASIEARSKIYKSEKKL